MQKTIEILCLIILTGCSQFVDKEEISVLNIDGGKANNNTYLDAGNNTEETSYDGCKPLIIITRDPLSVPKSDCIVFVLPPPQITPPLQPDPITEF